MSDHTPVLLQEIIDSLDLRKNFTVIDTTINGGGHAQAICEKLTHEGIFVGIDLDSKAISLSKERLSALSCTQHFVQQNFRHLDIVAREFNILQADAILFDLGWSWNQFQDPARGFSFQVDGPLRMTLSDSYDENMITAYDVVNTWGEDTLVQILRGFGDERFADRIAEAIVNARRVEPIATTSQLAQLITQAVPPWARTGKIHPATRTFQAIRIAVNDEYGALEEGIRHAVDLLAPDGRCAVITFHSGEDKIVKRIFKDYESRGIITLLNKHVIRPQVGEIALNRRARSAKLRVIQKNREMHTSNQE